MAQIIETVDIDAPVSVVYNAWTRFEEFPTFLDDIDSLTQESDTRNRWRVTIAGQTREFTTEITEQHPDERIAWTSAGGDVDHAGVATFHKLSDTTSRMTVQIDWEPDSLIEKLGSAVGAPKAAVKRQLDKFKAHVESTGAGADGWRGEVPR